MGPPSTPLGCSRSLDSGPIPISQSDQEGAFVEVHRCPSSAAAICALSWNARPVREKAAMIMKPYILDDASTLEYQRLDLMSKILDPGLGGTSLPLGLARAGSVSS
jgi:hypothetical protein